ncbi:hypothetical protein M378DRAFT_180178 [Amanita muscaria Koide BX008]|uniref:Methyltransferase type 11 domain-containing protein n=1 Tax=Amanita muscaria (strain Koide BX008) TaxID=946122 RepID=A0A0C2SDQ3_AMAMK|nr:hypothetical protein M378DRAFT_180178 [Amanita muscaria Koide BX008]
MAHHQHHEHHAAHGHHGHGELKAGHNFAQANREYFDNLGEKFDQIPEAISLAQKSTSAMMDTYTFKEGETVAMDFACGTGLISKHLVPHVKTIVGVDISQGMVDQYNLRVQRESIPAEKMRAVRAELEGKAGELDDMKFDVIVCSAAYHHFESIARVTQTLAFFLKPGGSLLVVDLEEMDPSMFNDEQRQLVAHAHGLSEAEIRKTFEGAGLESVTYGRAFTNSWKDVPLNAFIAQGIKPL